MEVMLVIVSSRRHNVHVLMMNIFAGFVTLSVLTKDTENIFKCGIAVAPVTNWIYYDTIYTERYLGLPTPFDNAKGYQDSDLTSKARLLKGKKLLLVHGTADDNGKSRRTSYTGFM